MTATKGLGNHYLETRDLLIDFLLLFEERSEGEDLPDPAQAARDALSVIDFTEGEALTLANLAIMWEEMWNGPRRHDAEWLLELLQEQIVWSAEVLIKQRAPHLLGDD